MGASSCFISNARTVWFTSAFGLHQLTSAFVFQYKANSEGRFSAPLGHVYQ